MRSILTVSLLLSLATSVWSQPAAGPYPVPVNTYPLDFKTIGTNAAGEAANWWYTLQATNTYFDYNNIYVVGGGQFVSNHYKLYWGSYLSGTGVWTNTASTNFIYMGDPGANIAGTLWVLEGISNATDLFFNATSTTNGGSLLIGTWTGSDSGGFSGNITVKWGTNFTPVSALAAMSGDRYATHAIADTNTLRVEAWGDDFIANRTNGFPFKTLYGANCSATNGIRIIKIGPGSFACRSFYSYPDLTWKGAGQNQTFLEFFATNYIVETSLNFASSVIALNTNVELCDVTVTNATVIGSNGQDSLGRLTDAVGCYVHDITVIKPKQKSLIPDIEVPAYLNYGVRLKSSKNCRIERVTILSGGVGIGIVGSLDTQGTNHFLDLIDNKVICSPEYSQLGTNAAWLNYSGQNGGMQAIHIEEESGKVGLRVNIKGGTYVALNGGTNSLGSPARASRNAAIYIAPSVSTNEWMIKIDGARLVYGSTNGVPHSAFIDENPIPIPVSGFWNEEQVAGYESDRTGTNTYVASGIKFRDHFTTPLASEVGTNNIMFWSSNGVARLLTDTNGFLVETKIGP